MIPASIPTDIAALQDAVDAARPLSDLTPLQLRVLIRQGQALLASIDAAIATVSAVLDGPDPSGHPLVMIATFRARRTAGEDASRLADLRGLVGRALLNLQAGYA